MWTLMIEGGFPMWFLLLFSLLTLAGAGRYSFRPGRRLLRLTIALGVATAWTAVTAMCADVAAVGHKAFDYLKAHAGMTLSEVLLQGVAEAMSPAILGFTVLSLAALLVAVGLYRDVED